MNLILGDCREKMKEFATASVDLVVTSPPYDNLRSYNGQSPFTFEVFAEVAQEMERVVKLGGVIVWVVNDATQGGSESGTSFRQALYFKEIGLNLHDTMIWLKPDFKPLTHNRYEQAFEYMFVFSKGKPNTFNGIKDKPNVGFGRRVTGTWRDVDGSTKPMSGTKTGKTIAEFGLRPNVWNMATEKGKRDTNHPAPFPEDLVKDHILTWSNPGDTVMDPFLGSGTTGIIAQRLDRHFIGIEKEPQYFEIAKRRIFNRFPPVVKQYDIKSDE